MVVQDSPNVWNASQSSVNDHGEKFVMPCHSRSFIGSKGRTWFGFRHFFTFGLGSIGIERTNERTNEFFLTSKVITTILSDSKEFFK